MSKERSELEMAQRAASEDEWLAGHQKSWINARTGEVMRLSQSPPKLDHDMFVAINAERMGIDLSGIAPAELARVLEAKTRLASTHAQFTVAAGHEGWVRVHRNTRTREVNIDCLSAKDALLAARIAVIGMRTPRSMSLDLLEGMTAHGREENLLLNPNEVSRFLQEGILHDEHGGTWCESPEPEVSSAMTPR